MKLFFQVEDKPKPLQVLVFALQQLLAIMAATLVVPVIINTNESLLASQIEANMSPAAALFGAGVGTLVYLLFTKFRSPVFLGSSFAFIGSMVAAFAGASTVALGYVGLILGAIVAGLVYVVIAIIVKLVGVNWIERLMPAVVIGPTVAIIGFSLAGNAIGDLQKYSSGNAGNQYIAVLVGLVTLAVTMLCASYGKKTMRMIPFIFGILAGYAVALIFTVIGIAANVEWLKVINLGTITSLWEGGVKVSTFFAVPDFSIIKALGGFKELDLGYIITVAVAYAPVAFVVFAEHIADHKNISSIIERDLLKDPGLSRTLLGDGVGSMAGALVGGCPNTTYGESVATVAISGNASVVTIITAAIGAILVSFLSPFVALINSIPSCVMGGICVALYGFIAVSGLKMLQKVDLNQSKNLFVASVILISGIGGLTMSFGKVTITSIACALILGILTNIMLSKSKE